MNTKHKDRAVPLKVLIAEDHYLVRKVTRQVIQLYYSVRLFRETDNIEELTEFVKQEDFDLLILDVYLTDGNTISVLPEIRQLTGDKTGILFFTMCQEETFAKRILQLGANGFLNKKADEHDITTAVSKVLSGEKYISAFLQKRFAEELVGGKKSNPFEALTNKEFEVMLYLLQGYPLSAIATAVHVSVSTISSHKKRLFDRLGVDSIVGLNQLATLHNIIP